MSVSSQLSKQKTRRLNLIVSQTVVLCIIFRPLKENSNDDDDDDDCLYVMIAEYFQ